MNATISKIENILTSPFETGNFVDLVRELFPNVQIISPDHFMEEHSNFNMYIKGRAHVGLYKTPDRKSIIILAVALNKAHNVENARSTQRSYAKKLIENGKADAALIAFYTEGEPKWRLSFVRLDYALKFENGRMKADTNMTPAKRYSFLVGEGEPCHTAKEQLKRFINDSEANPEHPTLDDLENAFSVEKVTDEFFKLYCEKFLKLQDLLEQNEDFREEAEYRSFTSVQFAKKLMGQIVFLYFLQKKGWLGVNAFPETLNEREYDHALKYDGARSRKLVPLVYRPTGNGTYERFVTGLKSLSEEEQKDLADYVKGKPWGTGPRDFMRQLFNYAIKKEMNFYDELLEPLFYDALNRNRGEASYCPTFHCRIPFLSGGLFEPIAGYDWEHNKFSIPNEFFSNKKDKNDREPDGLLDIFDRYNFTISEDEPMEREVAIDPEMLGKVFENLLEIKDRKDKGAFYTPREIVHYMCQESLISYLTNVLNISESAIRDFILYGDYMKDEDTVKYKREGRGSMYISEELYKINPDGSVAVNRLLDLDDALKNVRVADPAVGSGAFPLGMLNEIVRARQNITAYLAITKSAPEKHMMYSFDRSAHRLKYETIRDCIFACDLEPSAVDIAQLRLWLALVIDDEVNPDALSDLDGHRNPLPLPNLECNILCGNSLIDDFEGVRLIKESDILGSSGAYQRELGSAYFDTVIKDLMDKQVELFKCDDTERKSRLIEQIAELRDRLIRAQLEGCSPDQKLRYEESTKLTSKPYVLWQLDFARVFREKGGFDIVIGNPPYVQLQKEINEKTGEKLGDQYQHCKFETFAKTGDIYCLFFEKGCKLLHKNGVLSFITSNKWMRAGYGEKLRGFLAKNTNPIRLIDFAGQKVFKTATVDVNILLFTKSKNRGNTLACSIKEDYNKEDNKKNLNLYVDENSKIHSFSTSEGWVILSPIENSIKAKIEAKGVPLADWGISINYGIKTGCNEAFVISTKKKDELIAADPKSATLIHPLLRGKDTKRFGYDFAGLWLINVHNGVKGEKIAPIDIEKYPAIKAHLDAFYPELAKRADKGDTPYNLRNCAYLNDFAKQKLVWTPVNSEYRFCILPENMYVNNSLFMIVGENIKTICGLFNSKLFIFYLNLLLAGGCYAYGSREFFASIPLYKERPETITQLDNLVDKISKTAADTAEYTNLLKEIDNLVYHLYGLSENEVAYIETHC